MNAETQRRGEKKRLWFIYLLLFASLRLCVPISSLAQSAPPFDGTKWNISTGNLSTYFIQHSPVGAFPQSGFYEAPPSHESLVKMKQQGLVADEDYIAWGAVEPTKGNWNWKQHDAIEQAMHKAGLKYVAYCWVHFPPVWLTGGSASVPTAAGTEPGPPQTRQCTLMQCMEHHQETNYLSIFDPKTLEHYDHFYKALAEHFGDKLDSVYACILGPYGEGNYPLDVHDWIKIGHCHEGYWCADQFAIKAFAAAMKSKYSQIETLNNAWGTDFKSFDEIRPPKEISEKFKPTPDAFKTGQDRRRWLDFITWYHQAIIDFAEGSIKVTLKYFPKEKVRTKPGGTAAGINPIAWGTYSPGYAKMAGKYGIVLQPADCQGAIFGDKWLATAYHFYHVPLGTEPAGQLDHNHFVQRMFSDISAGASQFFTYEFDEHAQVMRRYVHLYTGVPGETEIALYCPTTLYRLGGNLSPTIKAAVQLRDLCDFDVLDELLITDGALTTTKYKALLLIQPEIIDQPVLDKFQSFREAGGRIILVGNPTIANAEGQEWATQSRLARVSGLDSKTQWLPDLSKLLADYKGYDGNLDGLWTTHRKDQVIILNTTDKRVSTDVEGLLRYRRTVGPIRIPPHTIWANEVTNSD